MKNSKWSLYVFFLSFMILLSCSKEKNLENSGSQVLTEKATGGEDPIVEDILWVLDNWEDYEGNVTLFINTEGALGWDFGGNGGPPPVNAIVCEGSGVSFARCCKDWLEANPGDCLKVTLSGGTFTADDDCE